MLGDHRLACGDATASSDVARLMSGSKAAMAFTDPPYNVALGDHGGQAQGTRKRRLAYAIEEAYRELLRSGLSRWSRVRWRFAKPQPRTLV